AKSLRDGANAARCCATGRAPRHSARRDQPGRAGLAFARRPPRGDPMIWVTRALAAAAELLPEVGQRPGAYETADGWICAAELELSHLSQLLDDGSRFLTPHELGEARGHLEAIAATVRHARDLLEAIR